MQVRWYFDFISPFAYLHWPKVRALAERQPVEFRPLLFAGLLEHNGQKGPAEIPAKRRFTYRHVLWLAQQQGVSLRFPPAHPFNPLYALRLCVAAGNTTEAISAIFNWLWAEGRAGDSLDALAPLIQRFGIDDATSLSSDAVKSTLRGNFDDALTEGVFGVPTLSVNGDCSGATTPMRSRWPRSPIRRCCPRRKCARSTHCRSAPRAGPDSHRYGR